MRLSPNHEERRESKEERNERRHRRVERRDRKKGVDGVVEGDKSGPGNWKDSSDDGGR